MNDKTFEDVTLWNESATQLMHDGAQAKIVKGHISTAEFSKQFRVSDKMTSGNYPIRGNLIYRACDNRMCTLPQSLFFESWIRIGR